MQVKKCLQEDGDSKNCLQQVPHTLPPPPLTHQKTDVPSLSAPAHLEKAPILKAEKVN